MTISTARTGRFTWVAWLDGSPRHVGVGITEKAAVRDAKRELRKWKRREAWRIGAERTWTE